MQENNESQSKYLGVCKLPEEGQKVRVYILALKSSHTKHVLDHSKISE